MTDLQPAIGSAHLYTKPCMHTTLVYNVIIYYTPSVNLCVQLVRRLAFSCRAFIKQAERHRVWPPVLSVMRTLCTSSPYIMLEMAMAAK
jgi:hypothetical protein